VDAFEWLFAWLERLQEAYLEPQQMSQHLERLEDAWLLYRIERLERRIKWLFLLALVVPLVEVIFIALWLTVMTASM